MAINKETQVSASVILSVETYDLVRAQAKNNGRSASSEMAMLIENGLELNHDGVEDQISES